MDRRPVGLLGPVADLGRQPLPADLLEQVLLREPVELERRRQLVGELDHPVVQEGEPPLHGVRHRHPVALRREQVLREEDGRLEVLGLLQRAPAVERVGVGGRQRAVAGSGGLSHLPAEEPLAPGGGPPPEAVRVVPGVGVREPQAEERLDEVRARSRHPRVDALEQGGARLGIGLLGPEAADLRLAEDVVAGQQLVGALAREDHLEAVVPHQTRQEEHRRRGRPHQGGLGVPDHLREHRSDVGVRGVHHVVLGPEGLGHRELEAALVVVRVRERDRERLERDWSSGCGRSP